MLYIEASAVISDCGSYRYSLTRRWSANPRRALFVMLNPSTADGTEDDPTIRRCVRFAQREWCGSMDVINLFSIRSKDPSTIAAMNASGRNLYGDQRAEAIARAFHPQPDVIIVAWGAATVIPEYLVRRAIETMRESHPWGMEAMCLGKTKSGDPRHPLYVRGDQPLERWGFI